MQKLLKQILEYIDKFSWLTTFLLFSVINIIFNYGLFWRQLIADDSKIGAVWGEVRVYEWLTSKFYRSLLALDNPFGQVDGMLYPFQVHLGLTDAANGFFYIPLRLFFSSYQSFVIIIALSQLFANVGMYLLLRKLKFDKILSCIISLAFTYMTFLAPREGHLSYWFIYMFPWFYLCVLHLISEKKQTYRYIAAIGTALFFALTLWINFYYFIMLCISIAIFFFYFLFLQPKMFFMRILKFWKEIFLIMAAELFLLTPWLFALYDGYTFDEFPKVSGWGGAIQYSSDLFSFFIPSQYNYYISNYLTPIYDGIVTRIAPFAYGAFENFTYPGLIILVSFGLLVYFFNKKDFLTTKKKLYPFLIVSCTFLVLTLGPFLHVLGKWGFTVAEGIRIVVPLPYALLHKIPFIENIRVPGRLIVAFIFFAYIVSAYIISYALSKTSKKNRTYILATMFIIFLGDHRYIDSLKAPKMDFPYQIFQEIRLDPEHSSVLELPFVVRDGFVYLGEEDAIFGIVGESFHRKPILGGYTGRIADYKKAYYFHNPLFGFLGRSIDRNLALNPSIDKAELLNWEVLKDAAALDTIDFLDIKYVIADMSKKNISTAAAELQRLGFQEVMKERSFTLLGRQPDPREFIYIDVGDQNAVTYLGMGWKEVVEGGRPTAKKASIMLKIAKERPMQLVLEGGAYKKTDAEIYLNKKRIGKTTILPGESRYILNTNPYLRTGINTVHIIFDTDEENKDVAFFRKVYLRDPE